MTTSMNDSPLFRGMFTCPSMCEIWDDHSLIQAWMDIWKALAQTQAAHGIIPQEAADEITKKCDVNNLDFAAMGQEVMKVGHALVPVPVSYTHLDVYKRQASDCLSALMLRVKWSLRCVA